MLAPQAWKGHINRSGFVKNPDTPPLRCSFSKREDAWWPRAVTHPGLPQSRTGGTPASGSSADGFATSLLSLRASDLHASTFLPPSLIPRCVARASRQSCTSNLAPRWLSPLPACFRGGVAISGPYPMLLIKRQYYEGSDCYAPSPRHAALPGYFVSPANRSTSNHNVTPRVALIAMTAPAVC